MKKFLFFLFLINLSFYSYGGIISGSPMLSVGEKSGYSALFFEAGTIEWSVLGDGISVIGNGESAIVTGVKSGTYVLTAKLRNYSGIISDYASHTITIIPFFDGPNIVGLSHLRPNQIYSFEVLGQDGLSYNWSFPNEYFDIISGAGTKIVKVKTKDKLGSEYITVIITYEGLKSLASGLNFRVGYPTKLTPRTDFICANDTISYQITDANSEDPIIWTPLNNLTLISGQGTPKAIFKGVGSGRAKVKAEIKYTNQSVLLEDSKIWVGVPPQVSISGAVQDGGVLKAGGTYSWGYEKISGYSYTPIAYSWNGVEYSDKPVITYTIPINATYFSIGLKIKNACGWSNEKWIRYTVSTTGDIGGGGPPEWRSITNQPEIKLINIYNLSGVLMYSNNTVDNSFDINSVPLSNGIYILEKFNGKDRTSEKIILKK